MTAKEWVERAFEPGETMGSEELEPWCESLDFKIHLTDCFRQAIAEAKAQERLACAQVAESCRSDWSLEHVVNAIRGRSTSSEAD